MLESPSFEDERGEQNALQSIVGTVWIGAFARDMSVLEPCLYNVIKSNMWCICQSWYALGSICGLGNSETATLISRVGCVVQPMHREFQCLILLSQELSLDLVLEDRSVGQSV